MKKILIILLGSLFCSAIIFAQTPATKKTVKPVPIQQSSSQQSQVVALVQELQQRIVDLQSLIALQGKEIQTFKTQQQQLYSDLNNKISMLKATANLQPTNVLPLIHQSKTTPKSTATQEETSQFQSAYKLMQSRQYAEAIESFSQYLEKFPQGYYAADAHYWLGELYVVAGESNLAMTQLQAVVQQYPDSTKAPDAMLKLGSIAQEQKQFDQAKSLWQNLINKYPQSSAARVAKTSLQQIAPSS